ncbi:MAG: hypothetical protein JRJ02_00820, partial [Deltaproteobacteria bacterium]|nr:hypothetical protein [Deltaproteobacteria bacterium]
MTSDLWRNCLSALKEIIIGLKGRVDLFQKSRIKNSHLLVERPLTRTI